MYQAPRPQPASNVIEAGGLFRGVILSLIERERDPSEKKARILIAYEHGHLTSQEAEDWIVSCGLEAA